MLGGHSTDVSGVDVSYLGESLEKEGRRSFDWSEILDAEVMTALAEINQCDTPNRIWEHKPYSMTIQDYQRENIDDYWVSISGILWAGPIQKGTIVKRPWAG